MRFVSGPSPLLWGAALMLGITAPAWARQDTPSGPDAASAQVGKEKEITLEQKSPAEALGLPALNLGGTRIGGFIVGSFSYNTRLQMVPEFAGGAPALADPGATNFRFDKFGLATSRVFSPWLSVGAAMEVESTRDRHSHGFDPTFGCPGTGVCRERFGSEEAETHVNLDKFYVTGVIPLGHGLGLSIGRFDVPFGIERHDEPLLLTATFSDVFAYGRPNKMTGLQANYTFAPWLDFNAWVVNRWEAEIKDDDFNDNNHAKSLGGRIGFTPISRGGLLNFGIGGWRGPEQNDNNDDERWVLDCDATWTPTPGLLIAAEAVSGGEENVSFRKRGIPYSDPAVQNQSVRWWGFTVLTHYDFVEAFGVSLRYSRFRDRDGARTGVRQTLQSWTLALVFHVSRLMRDLRPTGATFARTRHPIDWVDLKLEYRWNHSNRDVFSDAAPATDVPTAARGGQQLQLQVVVNF